MPQTLLVSVFIGGLNHLLESAAWARARLVPHAGRSACIELPPLSLSFILTADGRVAAQPDTMPADVRILLPAGAPWRMLDGLDKLLAVARVEGNAELATELSFVFRHLRWDVEEDLSRMVGDVAAHRLTEAGGRFIDWQKQTAGNLARNLADYLSMEVGWLVTRGEWETFRVELAQLDAALTQFEKHLARSQPA